jgi:hypothetical protein
VCTTTICITFEKFGCMCLLGVSMKIISLLMAKICSPKEKSQSEKYEYKVISPYKNTLCFLLPHGKNVTEMVTKMVTKTVTKMVTKIVTDLKFFPNFIFQGVFSPG